MLFRVHLLLGLSRHLGSPAEGRLCPAAQPHCNNPRKLPRHAAQPIWHGEHEHAGCTTWSMMYHIILLDLPSRRERGFSAAPSELVDSIRANQRPVAVSGDGRIPGIHRPWNWVKNAQMPGSRAYSSVTPGTHKLRALRWPAVPWWGKVGPRQPASAVPGPSRSCFSSLSKNSLGAG
jgi:hypothetical protein